MNLPKHTMNGNGQRPAARPWIGITPGYAGPDPTRGFVKFGDLNFCDLNYARRVERAGGLPLILAHAHEDQERQIAQLAAALDGLLLTGGDDVHPRHYDQEWFDAGIPPAGQRDEFELPLTRAFLATGKPILGICRGIQLVNVAMGGTLVQDIPHFVGPTHHSQSAQSGVPTHEVHLAEGCRLARVFRGLTINVNSHHHQAVDRVAEGFRVVGCSEEGIVEVIEHESHPYLIGVQWHPERLGVADPLHQELFDDFVQACREPGYER
ncbi:gamma-glutamyl-gamma-aminobutyrate hydrolase family protein [candidate division KSB1 bacterium]|nr:gamma-glutamyl-gamma-aminobutyrate hydrolase family protein [candidate division KSB1 bacterium]